MRTGRRSFCMIYSLNSMNLKSRILLYTSLWFGALRCVVEQLFGWLSITASAMAVALCFLWQSKCYLGETTCKTWGRSLGYLDYCITPDLQLRVWQMRATHNPSPTETMRPIGATDFRGSRQSDMAQEIRDARVVVVVVCVPHPCRYLWRRLLSDCFTDSPTAEPTWDDKIVSAREG